MHISDNSAPCYKIQEKTYEHAHHHLICQKCGDIIDFEDDLLEAIEKIIEVTKGFTITDHKVVFYGICSWLGFAIESVELVVPFFSAVESFCTDA